MNAKPETTHRRAIEVDLYGKIAVVAGGAGPLRDAVFQGLEANGSTLLDSNSRLEEIQRLDVAVLVQLNGGGLEETEKLCRAAAARMPESGGRIVIIAPVWGLIPLRGDARASAQAAGLLSLTKGLSLELAARGIRCNAIAVGAMQAAAGERLIGHVPMGRAGHVEEIANAALFLADPDNSYMTGHVLVVDGGWGAGYARHF